MKVNISVCDLELRNMAPCISEDRGQLDLEIIKWETDKNCYTVAYWVEDELSFVEGRPFNTDKNTFWMLATVGQQILQLSLKNEVE